MSPLLSRHWHFDRQRAGICRRVGNYCVSCWLLLYARKSTLFLSPRTGNCQIGLTLWVCQILITATPPHLHLISHKTVVCIGLCQSLKHSRWAIFFSFATCVETLTLQLFTALINIQTLSQFLASANISFLQTTDMIASDLYFPVTSPRITKHCICTLGFRSLTFFLWENWA